ncbi:MAG: hypothetical protein Q8P93_03885 [bacterium]|nr:hypothetical protein [bacterium]
MSFEQHTENDPTEKSWIDGIENIIKKYTPKGIRNVARAVGFASMMWASAEAADLDSTFVESPDGDKRAFVVEIGYKGNSAPVSIYGLDSFDPDSSPTTGSDIRIKEYSAIDKLLSVKKIDTDELHEMAPFYEKELSRPEILAYAGLTPKDNLALMTPRQAVLLSRAIVVENLNYDQGISDGLDAISDATNVGELTSAENKSFKTIEADGANAKEIYEKNMDIVCRNATKLFETNIAWMRLNHKTLRDMYVFQVIGRLGVERSEKSSHAWNAVAVLQDFNNDSVADGADLVFIDATPGTKKTRQESTSFDINKPYEPYQALETLSSLAVLRRQGVIDQESYRALYEDLRDSFHDYLEKDIIALQELLDSDDPLSGEDVATMEQRSTGGLYVMASLLRTFEKGAMTEKEKQFFASEEDFLLEALLGVSAQFSSEDLYQTDFLLADTILLRYEQLKKEKKAEQMYARYGIPQDGQDPEKYLEEKIQKVMASSYPSKEVVVKALEQKYIDKDLIDKVSDTDYGYDEGYYYNERYYDYDEENKGTRKDDKE